MMYSLVNKTKTFLRSLVNIEGRYSRYQQNINRPTYSFMTSVCGFDNKHTHYKTQIRPRWVYGDDACFISITEASYVLGVADGVGGWRSYEVDPSKFSKQLMSTCERLAKSNRFNSNEPMRLITESYQEVLDTKTPLLGSATFCILSLSRHDGHVYTVCLGDSGYLVIRRGDVIQRSLHQKHTFNTPFQLACLPPNQHGQFHRDAPEQSLQDSFAVMPGDLVVLGTDGLFDNLSENMILKELSPLKDIGSCFCEDILDKCSSRLVSCARNAAENLSCASPFSDEARRYGLNITGGVRGDITVILALVVKDSLHSDSEIEKGLTRTLFKISTDANNYSSSFLSLGD